MMPGPATRLPSLLPCCSLPSSTAILVTPALTELVAARLQVVFGPVGHPKDDLRLQGIVARLIPTVRGGSAAIPPTSLLTNPLRLLLGVQPAVAVVQSLLVSLA